MSKIKMRCNTCGKWFQSANAKEVTCPDCLQKARREKQAAKNTPPARPTGSGISATSNPNQVRPAPPPKPKPAGGGNPNRWFDTINDIKVGQPDQPVRPKIPSVPAPRPNRGGPEREGPPYERESNGPGSYRDRDRDRDREGQPGYYRDRDREGYPGRGPGGYRGPGNYRENERGERDYRGPGAYRAGGLSGTLGQRPRQPSEGGYPRGPRPGMGGRPGGQGGPGERPFKPKKPKMAKPKQPAPPRPRKEKQPPPAPFVPTPEQIAQVEARYRELAIPTEYDGIRTQIAKELSIPKKAVKKIIKDLREREEIPSWWDLQTYKGPSEELEKIKELYVPLLPLPDIGVHRQIAEKLELKPVTVYQAIKVIRQELGLPQYNDPTLHGIELKPRGKKAQTATIEGEGTHEGEPAASTATDVEAGAPAQAEATTAIETSSVQAETTSTEAAVVSETVEAPTEAVAESESGAEPTAESVAEPAATTEPVAAEGSTESVAQAEAPANTETAEAVPAVVDGNADHAQP